MARYRTKQETLRHFLYTNNKSTRKEIKERIQFTASSIIIKINKGKGDRKKERNLVIAATNESLKIDSKVQ